MLHERVPSPPLLDKITNNDRYRSVQVYLYT